MKYSIKEEFKNLTQSQLMIWTGQELNPRVPLYNVIMRFDMMGPIHTDYFKQAFKLLVQQSDAMKTVIKLKDGVPVQQVLDHARGELEFLDLSNKSDKELLLNDWLEQQNKHHFVLSQCVFQSALIKMGEAHYVWYLNQHHIIADAWGVTTQYKALSRFYHDLALNTSQDKDEYKLPQYDAFIRSQSQHATKSEPGSPAAYWEEKLKNTPPALRLYGHTQQVLTTSSKRITVALGRERSEQLKALAADAEFKSWTEHLSLYNIFITILTAYLQRVTGQRRLSMGTPAHNRSNNKFKQTPGLFIQFFPLFIETRPDISFVELYHQVRNETHDYMLNAVPGAAAASTNRSFQVILNYIHATFDDFNGIPMRSQWIHPGHSDPNHHLRLQVHDFDGTGNIKLDFDLNEQVFPEARQSLAAGHFLKLLDAFLEDRNQSIDQPGLLSTSEYQELVDGNGDLQMDMMTSSTVLDLFKLQVQESKEEVAVICQDNAISYQDLEAKSNQLAHYLMQQGIGPGSRVVLLMNRSVALIEAIWGILKSGACYVPVDPASPEDRVEFVIDDLNAAAILTYDAKGSLGNGLKEIDLKTSADAIASQPTDSLAVEVQGDHLAYIIYTSGTTGKPKGVMVSHGALSSYIQYAQANYTGQDKMVFPFFTTPAFDLTVTSIFTPLISGGKILIYPESKNGPDLAILQVIEENEVDVIKLTPSHIGLLDSGKTRPSKIQKIIVGGENFKSGQAHDLFNIFGEEIEVYNEYGPTEATVGCIVRKVSQADLKLTSIPIGQTTPGMKAYLLDPEMNPVPQGVTGEIFLTGPGLAEGYWNDQKATEVKFLENIFTGSGKMYRTGDLARLNEQMLLEYQGRIDRQVKIGGIRVEPGEIEAILSSHPAVDAVAVELQQRSSDPVDQVKYCKKCGLPSNYPSSGLDTHDTCYLCRSFEDYQQKVKDYFRQEQEFKDKIVEANRHNQGQYDCLMLLSGGKDSTYALARLAEMGFRVLAFTLDNGYISDEAKSNIKRVVRSLSVDHVFGQTKAMNAIFVDSLKRHCNVCNGCFKTIYTLSTNLAVEKGIPIIVTGLSRGQFFETRLTEELFRDEKVDFAKIDETILEARKAYHRTDDAVNQLLDVSVFKEGKVFDQVQYLDFYRYCDVSLDQMYEYLDQHLPWVRPSDTGRSTNCIINRVGIYEHKRRVGYSNYAFPYSWDVRVGHKTREDSLEEVNEEIDKSEVLKIMDEIGYNPDEVSPETQFLVAYITTNASVSDQELRNYLAERLPEYMIPSYFVKMSQMPLTSNGKIDYQALPQVTGEHMDGEVSYKAPENQIEQMLKDIWLEVLQLPDVGVDHNFIQVGGNSLAAIKLTARINESFHLDLALNKIFEFPTISGFGKFIESTIEKLLEDIS